MLYRLAVYLTQPYTVVLGLLWLSTLWLWCRRGQARRRLVTLTACLLLLTVLSMPAVGYLAIRTLESPYPFCAQRPEEGQAIVVLGGYTQLLDPSGEHVMLAYDSLARCLRATELYHSVGRCPVMLTGGKVDPERPGPTEARAMRDFLVTQGVDPKDMILEESSTSTYENVVGCRPLLDEHGWSKVLLVTDAMHMYRASHCFTSLGLEVTPSPCNHQAAYFKWSPASFAPAVDGLIGVQSAAHEWLGIAWYWLRGRI